MGIRRKRQEYTTATIKVQWPLDVGMAVREVIGVDDKQLAHILRVLSVKVSRRNAKEA